MVSPGESTCPSNSQNDQAFIKAVVQGLMAVGNGRVMELAEAKAKLSSVYLNVDAKYPQETSAILKMLEQSQKAVNQDKTISSAEAFSELRQLRGLI